MADLVIVEANVNASDNLTTATKIAGEAILRGQAVYADTADEGKMKLAINNGSAAQATVFGIAMTKTAGDGESILIATSGALTAGSAVDIGREYYVSDTAGSIAPYGDLTTGQRISRIYQGSTTTAAKMSIDNQTALIP